MASTIDKVKHALHLDHKDHTGTSTSHTHSGTAEGVAGPHSNRAANAADPRIDSDRDGSRNAGAAQHNATHSTLGNNHVGETATGGPHSSNLANKVDPTVKTTTGTTGQYSGTHAGNNTGNYGTGSAGGISHSTNAGPHNSNLLNKADPMVDSDLDGRGNRHGATGGGILGQSGSHATPGSGNAQNTAGPHNSDALNKMDPRVDADLDGSKTYGGNRTNA